MMKKDKNSLITAQTVENVSVIYQSNGIWQFYVYSCTLGVLKSALFFELLYSALYFVDSRRLPRVILVHLNLLVYRRRGPHGPQKLSSVHCCIKD